MRFIAGLIAGAALTLFVASAMDAPAAELLARGESAWQAIIKTTGKTLFEMPETPSPKHPEQQVPDEHRREQQRLDQERPHVTPAAANRTQGTTVPGMEVDAASPDASLTPAAALPPPPTLPGAQTVGAPPIPGTELDTLAFPQPQAMLEDQANAGLFAVERVPTLTAAHVSNASDGSDGIEPIWVPFHSEMSAEGFAQRLSQTLGHAFSVDRQGPGSYQVSFSYANEHERALLLDQLAGITGLAR